MDLEFLFSANPFATLDTSRFRMIRPNKSATIKLPAGEDHVFALPADYQSANVLVEITGGVLIMSQQHGATVKEVQPPKRQDHRHSAAREIPDMAALVVDTRRAGCRRNARTRPSSPR